MFNYFKELKSNFNLPNEFFMGYKMINISNRFLYIEGHKNIISFNNELISFRIKGGVITVKGKSLFLEEISDSTLSIKGFIKSIEVF